MTRLYPWLALTVLTWVLITPPDAGTKGDAMLCTGCADPGHLDEGAALTLWRKLGSFDDVVECRRARDARIAAARDDQEWADMQLSRCFPKERLYQGALRPGE